MKTITLDSDNYSIPSNWDELKIDQLVFLIGLTNKNISIQDLKVKMFLYCIGGHIGLKKINDIFTLVIGNRKYPVTCEQMTVLADLFDFLLSPLDKDGNCHIHPKLTRNPFPSTQCGCAMVYGPDDGLTNITYDQFIHLQAQQSRLAQESKAINEFISILYKKNAFKPVIEGDPVLINQMSPMVKTAIVWFYLGSLNFISNKFPRVFSGGDGRVSGSVFESQMKIVDSLADGDVTRKPEVRNSLLYEALFTMELAIERQENMKVK